MKHSKSVNYYLFLRVSTPGHAKSIIRFYNIYLSFKGENTYVPTSDWSINLQ